MIGECNCDPTDRSHRTPAPLSFPPHIVALGSLYTASMLLLEATRSRPPTPADTPAVRERLDIAQQLGDSGAWEEEYAATAGHVDGSFPPVEPGLTFQMSHIISSTYTSRSSALLFLIQPSTWPLRHRSRRRTLSPHLLIPPQRRPRSQSSACHPFGPLRRSPS